MSAMRPQSPYGGPMPGHELNNGPPQAAIPGHDSLPQPSAQYPAGPAPTPGSEQPHGAAYVPPPASSATPGTPPEDKPPAPASPYDFFMGDSQPQKSGGLAGSLPQNPGSQIALFAGGGLLIIIILVVLMFALPKGDKKEAILKVNQTQIETLRLCSAGQGQAKDTTLRYFSSNCVLSQTTESKQLTAYLTKAGIKIDDKVLLLGRNTKADEQLAAGASSSDYDDAYRKVITAQLSAQVKAIKDALAAPDTTKSEKERLTKYGSTITLLTKQLNGGSGNGDPNDQDIKINTPSETTEDENTETESSSNRSGSSTTTTNNRSTTTTNNRNSTNAENTE